MSRGFARNGWPRGSEVLLPSNLVASATPNTKGSWVEIDASASTDFVGLWVRSNVTIGVNATDTSMLLDIGVGAAASETVLVPDIPVGGHGIKLPFFLPIYIPSGTRLAGRIQGAVASDVYGPEVVPVFGSRPGTWGGYTTAVALGVNTATSGPTTGDLADNAWDEVIASTADAYRAVTIHITTVPGSILAADASMNVDVGVGGAGSEQVLGSARVQITSAEIILNIMGPVFIEQGIPAGSRLSIRKNSTSDLSAALLAWR